jgi:hypothetical protein
LRLHGRFVTLAVVAFGGLLAAAPGAFGAGSIVVNGNFEHPAVAGPFQDFFPPGFRGWRIDRGSVDVVHTFWRAASRDQSLELNGQARGAISQRLETVPGADYRLRFKFAGNPDTEFSACQDPALRIKQMRVSWDGDSLGSFAFDITGQTFDDMGWEPISIPVTASASTTSLRFTSQTDGFCGPAIDHVVVIPIS